MLVADHGGGGGGLLRRRLQAWRPSLSANLSSLFSLSPLIAPTPLLVPALPVARSQPMKGDGARHQVWWPPTPDLVGNRLHTQLPSRTAPPVAGHHGSGERRRLPSPRQRSLTTAAPPPTPPPSLKVPLFLLLTEENRGRKNLLDLAGVAGHDLNFFG